jgi:hypothetical protein
MLKFDSLIDFVVSMPRFQQGREFAVNRTNWRIPFIKADQNDNLSGSQSISKTTSRKCSLIFSTNIFFESSENPLISMDLGGYFLKEKSKHWGQVLPFSPWS